MEVRLAPVIIRGSLLDVAICLSPSASLMVEEVPGAAELRGTLLCHCRALSRLRPELSGF